MSHGSEGWIAMGCTHVLKNKMDSACVGFTGRHGPKDVTVPIRDATLAPLCQRRFGSSALVSWLGSHTECFLGKDWFYLL